MPRKTKEQKEENVEKVKKSTKDVSKKSKTPSKIDGASKVAKKTSKKVEKKDDLKADTKKTKTSKAAEKKATSTKVAKKKSADTKVTKKTATSAKTTAEKASDKKITTKKSTSKKATTKSSSTSKTRKSKSVNPPTSVEYYDLPYKYNQTIVKILYQNPTTLFVYWEISDKDVASYKNQYGENFFEITKPVLVVYNDTLNYHFEIDINDFANSWYFNINDSKCDYRIELIRKPISETQNNFSNYIHISSSNGVEVPNDKILFSTDEPSAVYFKNVKNNNIQKINLEQLLMNLNASNKNLNFPLIKNIYDLYKFIYQADDANQIYSDLNNPSSGNPSSHSLSSRFK